MIALHLLYSRRPVPKVGLKSIDDYALSRKVIVRCTLAESVSRVIQFLALKFKHPFFKDVSFHVKFGLTQDVVILVLVILKTHVWLPDF